MVTVHFVRHGEVFNPQRIVYGRLPCFRLSGVGLVQAGRAAAVLREYPVAAVFSSPLLRARQTAHPIAAEHRLAIRHSIWLNEIKTPYEGAPISILEDIGYIYANIPEEFESPGTLVARVRKFVRRVIREFPGQHIVAVTHGDIVLAVRLWSDDVPLTSEHWTSYRPYPAPGSITSITFQNAGCSDNITYLEPT